MSAYNTLSRNELITLCKERNLKGFSTKNKKALIELLEMPQNVVVEEEVTPKEKIQRLNYIGSKYQLLNWLQTNIQEKTGYQSLKGIKVADLFGGTGIVSYHFRNLGAQVISNDAELFSSIITSALTNSTYTAQCKAIIESLNSELTSGSKRVGFITEKYSPYESNERKFFTEENAQKIDHIRQRLEELKDTLADKEYTFLLASLLVSADAVSNVPAVYGCFLKNFKAKATKSFHLIPIHTCTKEPIIQSATYNLDVVSDELLNNINADIVYLDPPYNERQYSKNYFPLNIIAKTPTQLKDEPELKGKTGIPTDCFLSPFCKKGKTVEDTFDKLFASLKTKWIFLSYNSESLVSKNRMCEIMEKYGTVEVVERDYKRFKSFEYNEDKEIKEYLFCLKVRRSD
jgi:adenine-specific DNA-methyltransferase